MGVSSRIRRFREAAAANPDGFIQNLIKIPNLMGMEVDFRYQWAQQEAARLINEAHKAGKPVRKWFVKWRRAGLSAACSARNFTYAYGNNNARVAIIAHLEERSQELLSNCKAYYQSLPESLRLELAKDNIMGLKFADFNSQILIGTAKNPIKVRGDGVHRIQGTEAAHYFDQFIKVAEELCPVVPPLPGSEIIYETTGSVRGSAPYEHAMAAKHGQNEFDYHFLCWLNDPNCKIALPGGQREFAELSELIRAMEPRLSEKNAFYKLTPEQIKMSWQMYHLQSNNDFDYFCREFPYVEEEAWSSGSSSYFGAYELGKARPEHPALIYSFEQHDINRIFTDFSELRRIDQVDPYAILPNLKIWALPRKGARYVLGSDSSTGEYGGDYSAGYLIDMHTREMVAAYHGILRPDEAAHINVSLARIYDRTLLAPETNPAGGGMEALNCIQRLGYHYIYQWRIRDGREGLRASTKLGWWTHSRSRPLMLGELRKIFLDSVNERIKQPGMFRDAALIDEMRTFGTDPNTGIPRANNNCNDDRVMAISIAHQVAADEVYCTNDDMLFAYHKFETPKKPIDQSQLVTKKITPAKALENILGKNSGFMRNKFEI